MIYAKKHTCLICGHTAETRSSPLQCLHCGGLGFVSFFLAPCLPSPKGAGSGPPGPTLTTRPKGTQ